VVKSWAFFGQEFGPPFIIGSKFGSIWTSPDNGVTWAIAETLTGGPTINANAITKIGTAYIIGTSSNTFYRATPGMEGFVNSFSGGGFNTSVINGAGLYLVGRNQLNPLYWSTPDLVTFTSRTAPFPGGSGISQTALNYTGSYFIAGSSGSNTPTISRSLDGINWQDTRTIGDGTGSTTGCVSMQHVGGRYLANVSGEGIYSSVDFITWGRVHVISQSVYEYAFNGVNTIVASCDSGRIATSTDGGATWTTQTVGVIPWTTAKWVPAWGVFVVTSPTTSAQSIATSPDGITWTQRAHPATGFNCSAVR